MLLRELCGETDSTSKTQNSELKEPVPFLIYEYQLLWLDNQLNRSDYDAVIIFTHIPVFNSIRNNQNYCNFTEINMIGLTINFYNTYGKQ